MIHLCLKNTDQSSYVYFSEVVTVFLDQPLSSIPLMGCTFTSPLLRIYLGYYVPNFIRIGLIFWRVAKMKLVFLFGSQCICRIYRPYVTYVSYMIYHYHICDTYDCYRYRCMSHIGSIYEYYAFNIHSYTIFI